MCGIMGVDVTEFRVYFLAEYVALQFRMEPLPWARSHLHSVGARLAPLMPPSLPCLPARTFVRTLPRGEPMS